MINILLAGGSGTRLWPLSRRNLPKQFVKIFQGQSLFQKNILRHQSVASNTIIVSNVEHYYLALEQCSDVQTNNVRFILEPIGKNTAPAIAFACMQCDPEQLVFVSSSDHLITNTDAYHDALQNAATIAKDGFIVTFGIQPNNPNTGFGYIEYLDDKVISFTEKPDAQKAQHYIEQGNYYWNAGIFCFKAGVYLAELKRYSPEMFYACEHALHQSYRADDVLSIELTAMQAIAENSIDYAVLEKSSIVRMVRCDFGWSDLGSFDSLYSEFKKTEQDNALLAQNVQNMTPISVDSRDNLVVISERQIALVDVNDLLIVDTADALLIAHKGSAEKVKTVLEKIKVVSPELAIVHRVAYRPWGSFEVLVNSEYYKVKRLVVKPGHSLSLQKHFHRNEHWVVVSGTASVTVEDRHFIVRPNESTYIQMGQVHRLENQGKIDLVIIEVQVGEYTGEDDIVRLEDNYYRFLN